MRKITTDFYTALFFVLLLLLILDLVGNLVPDPYFNPTLGFGWYALCVVFWRRVKGERHDDAGLAFITVLGAVLCAYILYFLKIKYPEAGGISTEITAVLFAIFVKVQTAIYNTIKKCQK